MELFLKGSYLQQQEAVSEQESFCHLAFKSFKNDFFFPFFINIAMNVKYCILPKLQQSLTSEKF